MTPRTPLRSTTHRGPLATSPRSTKNTIQCSPATPSLIRPPRPTVDVAIPRSRTPVPSPLVYYRNQSRRLRKHDVVNERVLGLSGLSPRLCDLELIFQSLIYWACDLAKTLIGVVIFSLMIWALLESASYISEPSPPPNSRWLSMSHLAPTRTLRCHLGLSLCEPQETDAAVLQFLSDHIQHAKTLASLSVGLGLPLRAFFEAHQANVGTFIARRQLSGRSRFMPDIDTLTNLTASLDPPFLDFTPSSFIGKSFSLALNELGDIISDPPHQALRYKEHQEAHSRAIYWRTASNLLLEYSAARPRARELLQQVQEIHQELSPLVPTLGDVVHVQAKPHVWWKRKALARSSTEEGVRAFVTGLEVTMENLRRLAAYLDWITVHLAETTLTDVLKSRGKTDLSSCMAALQELFARSKNSTPTKPCFRPDDYKLASPSVPERIDVMVPGSPTVQVRW
ncbi:hypothetical protein PAXINDRAFT_169046 [Paxillus involutus ATCC 200175]|uniref:Unplaced genomic scaffold PAXINscaffold_14, whole genome shotgun sequence n=1 Tax=Paxillus involutus ATCC 200175 TaxID=664439 RepID=A0A0C9U883_PAXIN|nr:hypothetical protein PAXINDRAFT_169046 [Paxillus involutus ATCC 200175]